MIRRIALVLVAVLATAGTAHAQGGLGEYHDVREIPGPPAGPRMVALLEVINSGDRERAREFLEKQVAPAFRDAYPMEEHLSVFTEAYLMSRGYDFHSTRSYTPARPETELVAIVRNRLTEAWEGIIIEVEPEAPHLITAINVAPARPPRDLPAVEPLDDEQIAERLEVFARRAARYEAFSGTILLARDGSVLMLGAWGEASKRFSVPNEVDTKFNLGSMNKMFTAVAITQLVERGLLRFDDPVSTYLGPDWIAPDAGGQITIGHLLNHTSGLGSYFNDAFFRSSRALFRDVDDYKPLVSGDRPAFPPGSGERYSNTGYLLLGAVIESISGESYEDFVRSQVYQTAGMISTAAYEMDDPVPNLAIGYTRHLGPRGEIRWKNNLFQHVIRGGPAGGGFSTVEDLFRFAEAMRHEVLLGEDLTEVVWTPKPGSPAYGYGFRVLTSPDGTIVGHGGGFPGINAQLDIHRESGFTLVVLSNYDHGAQLVTQKTRDLIRRAKPR